MSNQFYKHKFELNSNSTKSTVSAYKDKLTFVQHGNSFGDRSKQDRTGNSKYKDSNYRKTINRRCNTVRKLIVNNFQPEFTSFITLTFNDNYVSEDYKSLVKSFLLFIRRIRKQFDNFKYIAVAVPAGISDTNSPRPHFHMVCNLDMSVTFKEIESIWKYGYVSVNHASSDSEFKRQSEYVIKNMKEASSKLCDKKGYLCSKDLNRSIIVKDTDADYDKLKSEIGNSVKTVEYVSEYKNVDDDVMVEYHNSFWSKKYSDMFVKLEAAVRKQ